MLLLNQLKFYLYYSLPYLQIRFIELLNHKITPIHNRFQSKRNLYLLRHSPNHLTISILWKLLPNSFNKILMFSLVCTVTETSNKLNFPNFKYVHVKFCWRALTHIDGSIYLTVYWLTLLSNTQCWWDSWLNFYARHLE